MRRRERPSGREAGSGYLFTVSAVLAFLLVFSFLLFAVQAYAGIRANKENVQRALDGFVTLHSVSVYDLVKRGGADAEGWDDELWELLASEELHVTETSPGVYAASDPDTGRTKWTMTKPVLFAFEDDPEGECICLRAEYLFYLDVPFGGTLLGQLEIPLRAEARFLKK